MPKVRDALLGVELDIAQRQRTCKRNSKHKIIKGEKCLVMRDAQGSGEHSYCKDCAPEILNQAKKKIEAIQKEIQESTVSPS